jgi:hypothetical protein
MDLLTVVFVLVVIGVLLYLVNKYGTMIDPKMKRIINWVVIIAVILWLCNIFGVFGLLHLHTIKIGHAATSLLT